MDTTPACNSIRVLVEALRVSRERQAVMIIGLQESDSRFRRNLRWSH